MPLIPEAAHRIQIDGDEGRVGKVRHSFDMGDGKLLFIASDRISAYDVVFPTAIPDKGKILTQMSSFWFQMMAIQWGMPHHLSTDHTDDIIRHYPKLERYRSTLDGRSMLVHKSQIFPIEAVVRGNLTGSGWSDYKNRGSVCGIPLPPDLPESTWLNPPLFTPATKAEEGHDENISFEQMAVILKNEALAAAIRDASVTLFCNAREYARKKGIIIADTKFEFARRTDGVLMLCDEVLTPDSSRFWPEETFEMGTTPPSLDKQFLRDWVSHLEPKWKKKYPAPEIPPDIVEKTRERYFTAFEKLTGRPFTP
jgi:phosphoribosylaminoimidazole-succinocarboxamide synthase